MSSSLLGTQGPARKDGLGEENRNVALVKFQIFWGPLAFAILVFLSAFLKSY